MSTSHNPPRLSATVMLLRDAPSLQVLMVARAHEIDFASGALVFPGGKVDEGDRDPAWGVEAGAEADEALAVRVAAARECFEEVGVLFARAAGAPAARLASREQASALADRRGPVDRGEIAFRKVVAEAGLALALDHFTPFARWVAPEIAPKRFDTHFFLAALPADQEPRSDGRETTEALWIEPSEALRRAETGAAKIVFPTRMNLRRLAQCETAAAALERFAAEPAPTVRPEVVHDPEGRPCLTLPLDAGYGAVLEPLARISQEVSSKSPERR